MEPRIRYFAMLAMSDDPLPAAAYLDALVATGYGVRALSIYGAAIPVGPWQRHAALFFGPPLATRYVNVVCAIPGLPMGQPLRARDLHPGAAHTAHGDEEVYTPQTALCALYTVGVPNVAITIPPPKGSLSDEEARALRQYDAILTPTVDHRRELEAMTGRVIVACSPAEMDRIATVIAGCLPD